MKLTLGQTNRDIINNLINDLLINTYRNNEFGYTKDVIDAIDELIDLIIKGCTCDEKKNSKPIIQEAMETLWEKYYNDFENKKYDSEIFVEHIDLNINMIKQKYPGITKDTYPYAKEDSRIIVRFHRRHDRPILLAPYR